MIALPWRKMRATLVLAVALQGQQVAQAQQSNTDNVNRLKTWRLADLLSQSTIGYAFGADKDRLAELRKDSEQLAKDLSVRLADLPKWKGTPKEDIPLAMEHLLTQVSGKISEQLFEKFGREFRATFDLAVMLNLALLNYSPEAEAQAKSLSNFLELAAADAKIPEELWKNVVAKIRTRAAEADVNKELKTSREAIGHYLAQKAGLDATKSTKELRTGRYQLWQLGQFLGAAAIGNMHGKKGEVEVLMKEADKVAKTLNVDLPELPARQNDQIKDGLAAMTYLIKTVGGPLGKQATKRFGAGHAKLYDLAVTSSLLTMLYGPDIDAAQIRGLRNLIEEAAREAGMPERTWKPLLKKVDDKADTVVVRQAVLEMFGAISEVLEKESKRD